MTRRSFVGILGAGAVAITVGAGVVWKASDDSTPTSPAETTLAPPPDPLASDEARIAAIATVGSRYLAAYPDDVDPAAELGLSPAEAADPAVVLDQLRARREVIRAELADGGDQRVASVDGWTVARTEARLAALLSQA